MTRLMAVCVFVTTAASMSASVWAQSPDPTQAPVFRSRTDLVQIDVVATDASGHPVHGLTKDDFTVLDRGTPRAVVAFQEVASERPAPPLLPPTLELDTSDNLTAKTDRTVILVLDDLHFEKQQANDVKSMARRVVAGLGAGTSIGLVTTSGVFGVEPTADRARVLDVIDRFVNKYSPDWVAPRFPAFRHPLFQDAGHSPSAQTGEQGVIPKFFGDMTMFKVNEDVAKMLRTEDTQRKAFVWLSRGMGRRCPPSDDEESRANKAADWYVIACENMLHHMRSANVAAYAVDPGSHSQLFLGHDGFLAGVARATGGLAIPAADLDAGIDRIVDDLNNFYVLGFTPPSSPGSQDTTYHHLDVRVARPDITRRYRTGYQVALPPQPKTGDSSALLVGDVLPKTDLRLRLAAASLASVDHGKTRVAVALEVRPDRSVLPKTAGPDVQDTFSYRLVAVDLNKKKVVESVSDRRAVTWRSDPEGAAYPTYQVLASLALAPGTYQLRISGESAALAAGGSVYLVTDVPDFRLARLALGGIVLGYARGARLPVVRAPSAATLLPFDPTVDRVFASTDRLRVLCDVWRGATVDDATVVVDLVDRDDRIVHSTTQSVTAVQPRVDVTVPLDGLAAAGYRIRVTATAAGDRAMREVGVIVQ
jgi:VWFA-related protein